MARQGYTAGSAFAMYELLGTTVLDIDRVRRALPEADVALNVDDLCVACDGVSEELLLGQVVTARRELAEVFAGHGTPIARQKCF